MTCPAWSAPPAASTVRALAAAVSDACNGRLEDAATVMCLDWHGPHTDGRRTTTGANTWPPRPAGLAR
ncbi:hypothetical protein GT025_08760 [Streptomyces sp. SID4920]|nr:hypothetical protein [Streptomyces sp. SID4920]MYX64104.1 hypothetical protein [Streptomyces sp. SID8373]